MRRIFVKNSLWTDIYTYIFGVNMLFGDEIMKEAIWNF